MTVGELIKLLSKYDKDTQVDMKNYDKAIKFDYMPITEMINNLDQDTLLIG